MSFATDPPGVVEPEPTIRQTVAVLLRRKWIVIGSVLLVPLAAIGVSLGQAHVYSASSRVLLSNLNLATSLTGVQNPAGADQPDRVAATQAILARAPVVASRALAEAGVHDLTVQDFLDASSVDPETNADILDFAVSDSDPVRARNLATAYASAYIDYRRRLDTTALERARTDLEQRLASLRKQKKGSAAVIASLEATDQKLRTMQALEASNAFLVQKARAAEQTSPKPTRNALLGLGLGIVLGIGLAFLWEALDFRVRTVDEIGGYLGLPLLGRIPATRRRFPERRRLLMRDEPGGVDAESYRVLRTNLELANLELGAEVILMASAAEAEGKSETAANLALALARAGKRVVLVDLDLRKPSIGKLFNVGPRHGVGDVAVGDLTLEEALIPVELLGDVALTARVAKALELQSSKRPPALASATTDSPPAGRSNGRPRQGELQLLLSGTLPASPGEFVGTDVLGKMLASVRRRADIVIIDAPASLHVGDGITLSRRVDAVLVVANVRRARRNNLKELRRALAATPTPTLGFVVTGVEEEQAYERLRDRGRLWRSRYESVQAAARSKVRM
jgi:tyrosine-protein kinase